MTGIPYRYHFGMGSRIIGGSDPVAALPDHNPVFNDDTTKRSPHPSIDPFPCQFDCLLQINDIRIPGHLIRGHL
jgi:hypothetical protein